MTFKEFLKIIGIVIVPMLLIITAGALLINALFDSPIVGLVVTVTLGILFAFPVVKYIEWLIEKKII